MLRFTIRRILRDVIQQSNKRTSLNAVTSRCHSHPGYVIERTPNHSNAETELTSLSNCNVISDLPIASSNSCVGIQKISSNPFQVYSMALISKNSNKSLEEEISCSRSEEITKNSDTEEDADKPCGSSIFDDNSAEKLSQSHSVLVSKATTTQSHAESEMFNLNNDCHVGYMELTFQSNSNVESSDKIETLVQLSEEEIFSLTHAESGSNLWEESEIFTGNQCFEDCVDVIPSTHFLVEAVDVTSPNLSYAHSETTVPGNIFRMLPENKKPNHNNVVGDDMRDSVAYTDSEVVVPDLESKIEIHDIKSDAQSNKVNSGNNRVISEEMVDSVAFVDSDMVIPDKHIKEDSKICCSNVESEVIHRSSDLNGVSKTISFSNTSDDFCPSLAMYEDSNTKQSLNQLNEECEIMDEFLNDMKEHIEHLTQEDFFEMLKVKEFGPYVNPYNGESGGPKGPEPTRYGEWEIWGKCVDF